MYQEDLRCSIKTEQPVGDMQASLQVCYSVVSPLVQGPEFDFVELPKAVSYEASESANADFTSLPPRSFSHRTWQTCFVGGAELSTAGSRLRLKDMACPPGPLVVSNGKYYLRAAGCVPTPAPF